MARSWGTSGLGRRWVYRDGSATRRGGVVRGAGSGLASVYSFRVYSGPSHRNDHEGFVSGFSEANRGESRSVFRRPSQVVSAGKCSSRSRNV